MYDDEDYFRVIKLSENVYALKSSIVIMNLIIGEHHALLFDTGYGFFNPEKSIRKITDLPLYIVNSHGHIDHAGGNRMFGNTIYINQADLPVYEGHQSATARRWGLESMKEIQELFPQAHILPKDFDEQKYINAPLFDKFSLIREGDTFDLGGISA